MSATNRSGVPPRQRCQTPPWAVSLILPHLPPWDAVLDPCCGEGNVLLVAKEHTDRAVGLEIHGPSARKARAKLGLRAPALPVPFFAPRVGPYVQRRNSLGPARWPRIAHVLTNPPYVKADAFAKRAIYETRRSAAMLDRKYDWWVAMLLRIGFAACRKRRELFSRFKADVFVLERRPIFWGGGSDASEYAWFLWHEGAANRWERLEAVQSGNGRGRANGVAYRLAPSGGKIPPGSWVQAGRGDGTGLVASAWQEQGLWIPWSHAGQGGAQGTHP